MIRSFEEVEEAQVTFYAGMLIAIFTFCEFLSGMIWAKISDQIGRRMTLLIGSGCAIIAAVSFGLSQSIVMAVVTRAFGGLFNPNVGLVQTCVVELAKEKEQQGELVNFPRVGLC
jgi:MFS family permease